MVGLVPTPADRIDYYPEPYGVRSLSWSNTGAAVGPQTPLALQSVADWQTLLIRNVNTGAPANASLWTVSWFHDPRGTLHISDDLLTIPPGVAFDLALPVKGPYVQVSAASATGAGSHPVGGWFGVAGYAPAAANAVPAELAAVRNVTVGAGASLVVTATLLRPGRATYAMECNSAVNWQSSVNVMDTTGTYQLQYRWVFQATTGNLAVELALPRGLTQVTVTNSDAAAHAWNGSLVSVGA